jgi:hypothetical protein
VRFYQKTLFIGESERYVKEGSEKGPRFETWRAGGRFTGDFGRQMMEESWNGAISLRELCEGNL